MALMSKSSPLFRAGRAFMMCVAFCSLGGVPVLAAPLDGQAVPVFSERPFPLSDKSSLSDDASGRIVVAQNFFQRLFGIGNDKKKKSSGSKADQKKSTKKKATARAPKAVQTLPKDEDAAVIAVFGDEFSQDIAFGLRAAFAKIPDVKVDIHSVGKSGLMRKTKGNPFNDFKAFVEKKSFNFAVVMVGLNDRRQFFEVKNEDGEIVRAAIKFQEPGWQALYAQRIDAVRAVIQDLDKPLYWVGLPPVRGPKLTGQLSYLNSIMRSRFSGRDERFIDIWDAFSNEDGDYVRRGPDLSGQDKNLRHKAGVRFTKAGRRKLAFFVEKLVVRLLSQSVDEAALPDALSKEDEIALKEGRGDRRGIFVVRQPPVDATSLLLPDAALVDQVAADSATQKAPSLRVDHFAWPVQTQ